MADNTTLNTGSGGDVIKTEDISGVKVQVVKAAFGSAGSSTDADSTHGLPVEIVAPGVIALADNLSNPTVQEVGGCLLLWDGSQWVRVRGQSIRKDLSALSITSIATVWTPTSGKKFRIMGGMLSLSAVASILAEDNSGGTTLFRTPKLLADTPYNFDLGNGILSAAANNVLKFTASAAASVTGTIWGTEE